MATVINGEIFKNMVTLAANAVEDQKEQLNQLNVFPVPDGDTGTNMALTLGSAAKELAKHSEITLGKAADITSSSLLRGARQLGRHHFPAFQRSYKGHARASPGKRPGFCKRSHRRRADCI